jgi:magnesium chelatase subunit I
LKKNSKLFKKVVYFTKFYKECHISRKWKNMELYKHFQAKFKEEKEPLNDIIGQEMTKRQLKSAVAMNRHIIIVGPPGIGKTTLAKNVARLLPPVEVNDCSYHCNPKNPFCPECRINKNHKSIEIEGEKRFVRIQGSPDLSVEDLLGDIDPIKALKYGPSSIEAFTPGKIFKANQGILFFDEVNRCPEKVQNALLQVLEEGKATLSSYDIDIPTDFIFIGTMNPQDTSTERLSDVFIDRFDLIYMTYPENIDFEKQIVLKKGKKLVEFPDNLLSYMIYFIRVLREDENLEKKPSVRASLGLYERAQSNAYLKGRDIVTSEDIIESIVSVLSHRIELKPSIKYLKSPEEYIREKFKKFSEENSPAKKGGGR